MEGEGKTNIFKYSNQLFIQNVDCWHLTIEICFSRCFFVSSLLLHYTGWAFNDPQIKTRQWKSNKNNEKKTTTTQQNQQIDWNWVGNVRCEKWETGWRRKKRLYVFALICVNHYRRWRNLFEYIRIVDKMYKRNKVDYRLWTQIRKRIHCILYTLIHPISYYYLVAETHTQTTDKKWQTRKKWRQLIIDWKK